MAALGGWAQDADGSRQPCTGRLSKAGRAHRLSRRFRGTRREAPIRSVSRPTPPFRGARQRAELVVRAHRLLIEKALGWYLDRLELDQRPR
jgi:hypothetical protein